MHNVINNICTNIYRFYIYKLKLCKEKQFLRLRFFFITFIQKVLFQFRCESNLL